VHDPRRRLQLRKLFQLGRNQLAVAEQQEFGLRMPLQRDRRPRYDHWDADVAAHGIQCDTNLARHERSGNLKQL
jgi:hypothetical protein